MNISGIKCDNQGCGYRDDAVKREQYPEYVGRPCPKCGCNLLTLKDYRFILSMEKAERFFDRWFGWFPGKKKLVRLEMNGTGRAKISKVKE